MTAGRAPKYQAFREVAGAVAGWRNRFLVLCPGLEFFNVCGRNGGVP